VWASFRAGDAVCTGLQRNRCCNDVFMRPPICRQHESNDPCKTLTQFVSFGGYLYLCGLELLRQGVLLPNLITACLCCRSPKALAL
jgi:hypothetical protein